MGYDASWMAMRGDCLSAATNLADLERRMPALERDTGEPLFVTFNHC
jgi:hypothetical protein